MRRLSSPITSAYKRLFPPFIAAVFVSVVALEWWTRRNVQPQPALMPLLVAPAGIVAAGFLIYMGLLAKFSDEAWASGTDFVARRGRGEVRVALSDISNVDVNNTLSQRRVIVALRRETRLGRQITFLPNRPFGLLARFRPDPVTRELRDRVSASRNRST